MPALILIVQGGVAIGVIPCRATVQLEPDSGFLVFLPAQRSVASVFAPIRDDKTNARAVGLQAVGLVLATAGLVAAAAGMRSPSLGWPEAIAQGAILIARRCARMPRTTRRPDDSGRRSAFACEEATSSA